MPANVNNATAVRMRFIESSLPWVRWECRQALVPEESQRITPFVERFPTQRTKEKARHEAGLLRVAWNYRRA
jgi:hypothetical protein